MTYKFVIREDIAAQLSEPWAPELVKSVTDRLLSERDAYRSMLKGEYSKQKEVTKEEYEKISGTPVLDERIVSYHIFETDWDTIDSEASRIMEKQK